MPYSDALAQLHGSGSSGGPLTSTTNALTGVSQSGTTLTYTVATGVVVVGGTVVLVGGAPTVSSQVVVTAILTGSGLTGTATVNISQTVTSTTATVYGPTIGDAINAAGDQYSNLELDFGAPNSGGYYPWLPQFPSLNQKAATSPAEFPGAAGTEYGVHIIVQTPFNLLTSTAFQVCTASHTAALVSDSPNPIAARTLTLAQLQVTGAHYFISVPTTAVLEFLRFYADVTGSNPTVGTITAYWGPRTGGER